MMVIKNLLSFFYNLKSDDRFMYGMHWFPIICRCIQNNDQSNWNFKNSSFGHRKRVRHKRVISPTVIHHGVVSVGDNQLLFYQRYHSSCHYLQIDYNNNLASLPSNRLPFSSRNVYSSKYIFWLMLTILITMAIPLPSTAASRCFPKCNCVYFKNKLQADCSLQRLDALPQVLKNKV